MFETLGLTGWTPQGAAGLFGFLVGLVFGAAAERSGFCIRRGLVGPRSSRSAALGCWLAALAVAVLGTQIAVASGFIAFDQHRFHAAAMPLPAALVGGALFGVGMVLTRGCASRITVLAASGNLRALVVLIVFAIVALMMVRGILAPLRIWAWGVTIDTGGLVALDQLPGGAWGWTAAAVIGLGAAVARSGASRAEIALGALIGLLVPLAWIGTGLVLADDFDPIPMESLTFTAPALEGLFWLTVQTGATAGFTITLMAGTLAGAFASAVIGGRFRWQGFETPAQMRRFLAGAVLMGVGGVMAGGCTVGAGMTGVSTLSIAALLTLMAIAGAALLTHRLIGDARAEG